MKAATKTKTYYNLIVKTPGQLWSPEFGDYVHAVVKDEMADYKRSFGSWPKGTRFDIITTDGTQADLTGKLAVINEEVRRMDATLFTRTKAILSSESIDAVLLVWKQLGYATKYEAWQTCERIMFPTETVDKASKR